MSSRRQYGSSKSQPCICGRLHFQTLASLKNFYILSLGPLRRHYTPSLEVVSGIEGLSFVVSAKYGAVTSCPTNIGSGMRGSVHVPLPNLTTDGTDKTAKAIARPLGLSVRGTGGEDTPIGADGTVDISGLLTQVGVTTPGSV